MTFYIFSTRRTVDLSVARCNTTLASSASFNGGFVWGRLRGGQRKIHGQVSLNRFISEFTCGFGNLSVRAAKIVVEYSILYSPNVCRGHTATANSSAGCQYSSMLFAELGDNLVRRNEGSDENLSFVF